MTCTTKKPIITKDTDRTFRFSHVPLRWAFLDDGINTEGSMGRMVITILTAVAEAERARILERTNEGRIDARLKGIRFGRKRKIDRAKLLQLQEQGITGTALAKKMNISRTAVYNILKEKASEALRS